MANYLNSVSDTLVVCKHNTSCTYFIFNSHNQLKYVEKTNVSSPPDSIATGIFKETHLVYINLNFVLVPNEVDDYKSHFELAHMNSFQLKARKLESVTVVSDYVNPGFDSQFVNPQIITDTEVIINYGRKRIQGEHILFYENENTLSIYCFKNEKLQFANRFTCDNTDELVYYLMLTVEQLELNVQELAVSTLASKGQHEEYLVLFKNYLPSIRLIQNTVGLIGLDEESQKQVSQNQLGLFLAECAL